jgi:hypothetical protein
LLLVRARRRIEKRVYEATTKPWTSVPLVSVNRSLKDNSDLGNRSRKKFSVFANAFAQGVDNPTRRVNSETRLHELWGSSGEVDGRQLDEMEDVVANDLFDGLVLQSDDVLVA